MSLFSGTTTLDCEPHWRTAGELAATSGMMTGGSEA